MVRPLWFVQLKALLRKNFLLTKRRRKDLIREIMTTFLLLFVLVYMTSIFEEEVHSKNLSLPANLLSLRSGDFSIASLDALRKSNGTIAIAPCNSTKSVQAYLAQHYPQFCQQNKSCISLNWNCFASASEMIAHATSYANLFAGVEFDSVSNANFTIYMNKSQVPYPSSNFRDISGPSNVPSTSFIESGFLALQSAVQEAVIFASGKTIDVYELQTQQFPEAAYSFNPGTSVFKFLLPIYFMLIFGIQIRTGLAAVLEEKEEQLVGPMTSAGLKSWVNILSWIITFTAKQFVVVIVATIAASVGGIFGHSDGTVLFLFFFLFAMTCNAYILCITPFFKKAKMGSVIGYLLFIILGLPTFLVTSDYGASSGVQAALNLLSPISFGVGIDTLTNAEAAGIGGISWSNISIPVGSNTFSLAAAMGMLAFDVLLYFLLAWYLESAISERQGCCFCFKRNVKSDSQPESKQSLLLSDSSSASIDGNNFALEIKDLQKTFHSPSAGEVKAVNGLSLGMYEGQVTCVLGHNGAGKTTTINVLTGQLLPDSGDATVYGLSLKRDVSTLRSQMGVCPQHNILFKLLTVRESMELFAAIKGIGPTAADTQITELLEEVGLTPKIDTLTKGLSGGMKRKLSVALSLVGNPKVVYLDEPTAGMDPEARRSMWNLINRKKAGRVVVLTTHFMDEADLLGDRIAVMDKGALQVVGTSLSLKSKFGIGYHLNIEVLSSNPNFRGDQVVENVRSFVPAAKLQGCVSTGEGRFECKFVLPLDATHSFADLFQSIEDRQGKEIAGVTTLSYGVSQTSLEEVFLRLADHSQQSEDTEELKTQHNRVNRNTKSSSSLNGDSADGTLIANSYDLMKIAEGGVLSGMAASTLNDALKPGHCNPTKRAQFKALFRKRFQIAKRDKASAFFTILLPIIFTGISSTFSSLKNISTDQTSEINFSPEIYDQRSLFSANRLPLQVVVGSGTSNATVATRLGKRFPLPFDNSQGKEIVSAATFLSFNATGGDKTFFLQSLLDNCQGKCGAAVWLPPKANDTQKIFLLYNSTYYTTPGMLLDWVSTSLLALNNATLAGGAEETFQTAFAAFPKANGEAADQAQVGDIVASSSTSFYASSGFISIAAVAVVFLVKERADGSKHQQLIGGVAPLPFWGSVLAFDCTFFVLPVIGVLAISAITGDYGGSESFLSLTILLVLFGPAVMTLCYIFSFFFERHTSAQTFVLLIQFILNMVIFALFMATTPELSGAPDWAHNLVQYIGMLVPNFALNKGLSDRLLVQGLLENPFFQGSISPFDFEYAGSAMLYLAGSAALYFGIVLRIEHNKQTSTPVRPNICGPPEVEDEDVAAERSRVTNVDGSRDNIALFNLRKVYPASGEESKDKVAVADLVLGIKTGTCFGLLGPNGAGKTTLLSMLTGVQAPSAGDGLVGGHSICTAMDKVYQCLGYCPQFDALYELLTGREHLTMYANVIGVSPERVPVLVDSMLQLCGLSEHADKLSKEYSGGNKRKLSLAIALLGTPSVLMLDEPSTGMDPMARRSMANLVHAVQADRSVLLTTHLMEECEALSSNIGIMINGALVCLGTTQHIKARFGGFWQVEIQSDDETKFEAVKSFVQSICPSYELLEWHLGHFMFKLPSGNLSLATVFRRFEQEKAALAISNYAVSQCSLEQIFLAFARNQVHDEDS